MHKLFVYGTLRREAEDQTLYYVPGMALFDLGQFPSAGESRYFRVIGQILECDDEALAAFDKYEGLDRGLYTREKVNCLRLDGEKGIVDAWIYVGGKPISDHIEQMRNEGYSLRISSGDWYADR